MTNAEKVWELYKIAKEGQTTTIRSGYGLHGIYPYDSKHPFDFTRSESDAEHVFGTIVLLTQVMEFYPYLIPKDRYGAFVRCLLFHELGENESGDIPDDGRRDDSKKDAEEFEYVKKYLDTWSKCDSKQVLEFFSFMQKKDVPFGWILYFIDKTEAILQNLLYEKQGRTGSFEAKKKFIEQVSERDRIGLEATKSDKPADVWSFHFYNNYHGYEGFNIFFNIIRAAVRDVRGEDFNWLIAET